MYWAEAPGDLQGIPAPSQGQGRGEQLPGQGQLLHGYHGGAS